MVVLDGICEDADVAQIQIVRGLVEDDKIGVMVVYSHTTQTQSHEFTSAELFARPIPCILIEQISVKEGFYFVVGSIGVVKLFDLMQYRLSAIDV